jgi:membrane protease YdiL (CAAX protease family)
MSLLAWLMWRVARRGRENPPAPIFWIALVVTAVVFGAGHLGAARAQLTLTPALVSWIIVGNAIAGIAYGWLFWKQSLEAAMVAHASGHVLFTLAAWTGRS